MNLDMIDRVQMALNSRLTMIRLSEGTGRLASAAVERSWNQCLEGVGARRVGRLMGLIVGPEPGVVRFKDPLGEEDNKGFVDMTEEAADKVATLGLP